MSRKSINDEKRYAIDNAFKTMLRNNKLIDPDLDFSSVVNLILDTPLTLYVDSITGSDVNNGRTPDKAYATIQAALDSLTNYEIKAAVTIDVAAGTYPGFNIGNLNISNGATGLTILGKTAKITPATGTASGTMTGGTAGTITDSTQIWTTNDLKGSFILITSGSLSGVMLPIYANTATTLSFTSNVNPFSAGATTYEIHKPTVFIQNTVAPWSGFTTTNAINVTSSLMSSASQINLKYLSVSPSGTQSSNNGVVIRSYSGAVTFTNCFFSSGNAIIFLITAGIVQLTSCVFQAISNLPWMIRSLANGAPITLNIGSSYFYSSFGVSTNAAIWITGTYMQSFSSLVDSFSLGLNISGSGLIPTSPSFVNSTGAFLNCPTAILMSHPNNTIGFSLPFVAWSGNTNGLTINKGAKAEVFSTFTGFGATNEIVVDGVNYTRAQLQANSPKVVPLVPNPYGTIVYE